MRPPIGELLGDVGELLDRAEALKGSLPTAVDTALGKVRSAGDAAAGSAGLLAQRFLMTFDSKAISLLRGVQKAAQEAQAAARVVDRASPGALSPWPPFSASCAKLVAVPSPTSL